MAYKLVIGNIVRVPVQFSLNDDGKVADFSFTLICKRLDQAELKACTDDGARLVSEFMSEVITGWNGQTLVVDEAGKPVEFNPDALQMMLDVAGVPAVFYAAYLKESGAKGKN